MTHPEHVEQLPPDLFPTLAVCWATMDTLQTEDALDELQDWVAWALDRYALDHRVVPECWDNHGALVEEFRATHRVDRRLLRHRPAGGAAGVAPELRLRPPAAIRVGIANGVPAG